MDPTPENLQTLSNYLKQTMSPVSKDRNQAEKFLQQHEGQQGFSLLLLNLLGSDSNDPQMQCVKLAAAINFKNFIKRNWKIVSFHNVVRCFFKILSKTAKRKFVFLKFINIF
jgi:exportin-2 (importin alpha re-exporter)